MFRLKMVMKIECFFFYLFWGSGKLWYIKLKSIRIIFFESFVE